MDVFYIKTKITQISVTNFIHYTNIMFVIPQSLKFVSMVF